MGRVKKKDYENLTATNIEKVISQLNKDQPISKKEACAILNIAYNTARLQRIIDDYEDKKLYREKRKAQNRGRAATSGEISEAVEQFLGGASIAEIAKGMYRSSGFVKAIIQRVGVPQKTDQPVDYLPEQCVAEDFSEGELVWSAKYSAPAIVEHELSVDYQAERPGFVDTNYERKYSSKCYAIYVIQKVRDDMDVWANVGTGGFNAFSLAYDLGKLEHLKEYGVDLSRI